MRVSKGNPWSVMLTSFLLLAGLGVLAVASTLIVWTMLNIMAPEDVPTLATTLTVSAGVVLLEVVLGTCFATLSTFIYNLSSPYHGGVQLAVTDDLTDPTPAAAEALLSLARARARVRRYLRTHTPPWASARGRRPGIGARSGAARPTRPHPAADGPARTTDNADNSREVSDTA
ncbi:DUF3566 domain-containing protein [Streptomyces sp. NPDC048514]|uniref:DUF3566 domain-containing protein n=1 Tax=Streptomyces sp. NPDC048514 TaxID=3365564 RepID=UPI003718FEA4